MRPARALIDLQALRRNYLLARELGGGRALAVVKADAYGHGAVRCAQALEAEADGFAVACIEEALALREAGIRAPILLLEGFFEADELALIDAHGLWCVVHAPWQIEALERARPARPLQLWLKLDTGMHRIGLAPAEFVPAWRRLQALPQVRSLVAMSHFARADELDCGRTREQIAAFEAVAAQLGPVATSLANSPGLLGWDARSDWSRPGLMLYGASPFVPEAGAGGIASASATTSAASETTAATAAAHARAARLQPVMTFESRIIAVRELAAGEPVGYGGRFVTECPSRVGVVAAGYADGYPQFAPAGTPVAIDGAPGRLVGRVSMDMLTVDLTDHPQAGVGSRVQLWGDLVPVAQLAARAGSSAYRLLSGLKRVPREYA